MYKTISDRIAELLCRPEGATLQDVKDLTGYKTLGIQGVASATGLKLTLSKPGMKKRDNRAFTRYTATANSTWVPRRGPKAQIIEIYRNLPNGNGLAATAARQLLPRMDQATFDGAIDTLMATGHLVGPIEALKPLTWAAPVPAPANDLGELRDLLSKNAEQFIQWLGADAEIVVKYLCRTIGTAKVINLIATNMQKEGV